MEFPPWIQMFQCVLIYPHISTTSLKANFLWFPPFPPVETSNSAGFHYFCCFQPPLCFSIVQPAQKEVEPSPSLLRASGDQRAGHEIWIHTAPVKQRARGRFNIRPVGRHHQQPLLCLSRWWEAVAASPRWASPKRMEMFKKKTVKSVILRGLPKFLDTPISQSVFFA